MPDNQDIEAITKEIEQHAAREGHALAVYIVQYFTGGPTEIDFEQHRIADYIFNRTAADVLARFPRLIDSNRLDLQNRAKAAIKAAFRAQLANLTRNS